MMVMERVAHARAQAQTETYDRLADAFSAERRAQLDTMLVNDASVGTSRLRWLSTGPVEASATAERTEVDKLVFRRDFGADELDMSVSPRSDAVSLPRWAVG